MEVADTFLRSPAIAFQYLNVINLVVSFDSHAFEPKLFQSCIRRVEGSFVEELCALRGVMVIMLMGQENDFRFSLRLYYEVRIYQYLILAEDLETCVTEPSDPHLGQHLKLICSSLKVLSVWLWCLRKSPLILLLCANLVTFGCFLLFLVVVIVFVGVYLLIFLRGRMDFSGVSG